MGDGADLRASTSIPDAARAVGARPAASRSRLTVADVTSRAMLLESARKQISHATSSSS